MATLEVLGVAQDVYRTTFRLLPTIWPATAILVPLILAREFADVTMFGPDKAAVTASYRLLFEAGYTVLTMPYVVAVYEAASREPGADEPPRRTAVVRLLAFAAFMLLISLGMMILAWCAMARDVSLSLALAMAGALLLTFWLQVRSILIGPAIALRGVPVNLRVLFAATRGHVWGIVFAALLSLLPVLLLAVVTSLLWLALQRLGPVPDLAAAVLACPMAVLKILLPAVFTFEVYRRLAPVPLAAPARSPPPCHGRGEAGAT